MHPHASLISWGGENGHLSDSKVDDPEMQRQTIHRPDERIPQEHSRATFVLVPGEAVQRWEVWRMGERELPCSLSCFEMVLLRT